jgi:ATP-dependent DNA ligase
MPAIKAAPDSSIAPSRGRTDGFIDPCIPTRAAKAPAGQGWVHEIKHDGYRLIVRLFTRRGHDWTARYPAIASAAAKLVTTLHGVLAKVKPPGAIGL